MSSVRPSYENTHSFDMYVSEENFAIFGRLAHKVAGVETMALTFSQTVQTMFGFLQYLADKALADAVQLEGSDTESPSLSPDEVEQAVAEARSALSELATPYVQETEGFELRRIRFFPEYPGTEEYQPFFQRRVLVRPSITQAQIS